MISPNNLFCQGRRRIEGLVVLEADRVGEACQSGFHNDPVSASLSYALNLSTPFASSLPPSVLGDDLTLYNDAFTMDARCMMKVYSA